MKIFLNSVKIDGRDVSSTIVSGYFKFGVATIFRNFNGGIAVIEIEDEK